MLMLVFWPRLLFKDCRVNKGKTQGLVGKLLLSGEAQIL